jgi:hypothetical protein
MKRGDWCYVVLPQPTNVKIIVNKKAYSSM